ncbi:MAG: EamA family transporter [Candidatus Bathyarchaeota archaeon]|nr:MAG: EamA family transporter [Candidatus Bathyarchaeota archaeon]
MFSSGLLLLLFFVGAITTQQIILRISQQKGRNIMASIAVNYIVAAVICFVVLYTQANRAVSSYTMILGVVMGFLYLLGINIMTVSYRHKGVALTSSILQLTVLVPTLLSIAIWGETTSAMQTLGIVLALASLPLLTMKSSESRQFDRTLIWITLANFVVNGVCMSAGKILLEAGYADQYVAFYGILFLVAFLASLPFVIRNGNAPSTVDVSYGTAFGILNAIGNFSFIQALTFLPGSIAYPISSSLGLLATVGLSVVLLHERINRINALGIISSLVAVVLINL